MRDRTGLTICKGDAVEVQTLASGPVCRAVVTEADSGRTKELDAVLVSFDNGTAQFMHGSLLRVVKSFDEEDTVEME